MGSGGGGACVRDGVAVLLVRITAVLAAEFSARACTGVAHLTVAAALDCKGMHCVGTAAYAAAAAAACRRCSAAVDDGCRHVSLQAVLAGVSGVMTAAAAAAAAAAAELQAGMMIAVTRSILQRPVTAAPAAAAALAFQAEPSQFIPHKTE